MTSDHTPREDALRELLTDQFTRMGALHTLLAKIELHVEATYDPADKRLERIEALLRQAKTDGVL